MHIDSYEFGKIVIDGVSYTNDCLIVGGAVRGNWWRKQGHSLAADDLEPIIAAGRGLLIIGCGESGLMDVPRQTRDFLREHDIEFEVLDTVRAVQRFNELSAAGTEPSAALHLSC